jgi:uncharacterized protein with von Willebrand factor type A (vWA) domain
VWKDNRRRFSQHTPTLEVMRTYGADYRLILVGDATMGPYELSQPGGSVEHWNDEPGALWIERLCATFPHHVWLNPEPVERWQSTPSIRMLRTLLGGRMFPLTLGGLEAATRELRHAAPPLSALPAEPRGP